MAAVSNDADGLPIDQNSNNLPLSSYEDEEIKSTDLVTIEEAASSCVAQVSPDKKDNDVELNQYSNPMFRSKRKAIPLLPRKPVKVIKVKKIDDPKPTIYFPVELNMLNTEKRCPDCHHSTCHDLIYGDFSGLQATEYAKKLEKGTCSDLIFKKKFTDYYTSALKFHRYLTTGVIDTVFQYELPACMTRSSFRNFFAVFKVEQERVRMQRVVRSGLFYEIRSQPYEFNNEKEL